MRRSITLTIAAGTPLFPLTGTSTAPSATSPPEYATRVSYQMVHGASAGLGYVYSAFPGKAPTAVNLIRELAPATATAPGGDWTDTDEANPGGGIDMRCISIDGSHTGDTMIVTWDPKV